MKMQELYELLTELHDEVDLDQKYMPYLSDLVGLLEEITTKEIMDAEVGDYIKGFFIDEIQQIKLDFESEKPRMYVYFDVSDDTSTSYGEEWLGALSALIRYFGNFDINLYFSRGIILCDLDEICEGHLTDIIPCVRSCRLNADSFTQYNTELYALEKMEELTLVLGEGLDERDMERMIDGILNMSLKKLEIDLITSCSEYYLQFIKDSISPLSERKILVEWNDPFELHGGGCVTIDELG